MMVHQTGRVLLVGFDPAKSDFDRACASAPLELEFTEALQPDEAAAAVEQGVAAGTPFQLAVLRVGRANEAAMLETARRLQAADAFIAVLLAAGSTEAANLRARIPSLGERVFVVNRPL